MATPKDPTNAKTPRQSDAVPLLTVRVSPRRFRIVALTLLTVGVIAASTLVFHHGYVLSTFDARTKPPAVQSKLLDDYNSYSGFVSSAFGKPIEMFVAMAAQVVVLRLLAKHVTRPTPTWHVGVIALAAAAVVGYLVGNGFNALNVQLQMQEMKPKISAADLSAPVQDPTGSSTVSQSFSELSSENGVANTMARNLLLQAAVRPASTCPLLLDRSFEGDTAGPILNSGLPRRDWFSRVLPRAVKPATLKLVVNPTDPNANANVRASDLPMNATRAADLFLYAMTFGDWYFPFGDIFSLFGDYQEMVTRYPILGQLSVEKQFQQLNNTFMAEFTGLLPLNSNGTSETELRESLLRRTPELVKRQLVSAGQVQKSDLSLEFSHVDISPSVTFDAVTLEFEMDPTQLANAQSSDNTTRFTNLNLTESCGPWPGLCLVPKRPFRSSQAGTAQLLEEPAQVKLLSSCADEQGLERFALQVITKATGPTLFTLQCPKTSTSSVLVLSFAKKLVADSITQNTLRNASGTFTDPTKAVITNLRKIYTFTVGRLSWQLGNLSAAFNASCDDGSDCLGLQLPLVSTASATGGKQHLLVGADALPLERLAPLNPRLKQLSDKSSDRPRFVNVVEAFEPVASPSRPVSAGLALSGDPLLLHNIGTITWNATVATPSEERCDARVEDRLGLVVDNHLYSEHSLQPAYTAATWFLFQNGVVRDSVTLPNGVASLAFAANVERVAVWISTPKISAYLTLAGCALLAVGLLAAVAKSSCSGPLHDVSDPHVIARVLVQNEQFPPQLLKRRVVGDSSTEERVVASLSLKPLDDAASKSGP